MAQVIPYFYLILNIMSYRNKQTDKCTDVASENLKTLADIINAYKESSPGKQDMIKDLKEVKKIKGYIEDILERCVCNRNRHQYCISQKAVDMAVKELMKENDILPHSSFNQSFEVLYDRVKAAIGNIPGIGNSTLYDTCIRLGWTFDEEVEPSKYVYVHRDLVKNAEAILGKKYDTVKEPDRPAILRQEFINIEPEFEKLTALDIENLLCIYHDDILTVTTSKSSSPCP